MRIFTWISQRYENSKISAIYPYENIDTGTVRIIRKQKYVGYY